MAASETMKKLFFNDEDTLSKLLSRSLEDSEMTERLDGVERRLMGEVPHESVWETVTASARNHGVNTAYNHAPKPTETPISGNLPEALKTEEGKHHLAAVEAILGVSSKSAVEVTLSALQSLSAEPDDYPKVIGTRIFLEKVVDFHFHQRLARLSIILECVRAEQDNDMPGRILMTQFLDKLDNLSSNASGEKCGIFCFLLSVACCPQTPLSYEQLHRARKLTSGGAAVKKKTVSRYDFMEEDALTDASDWKAFERRSIDYRRAAMGKERDCALEGLVVLVYDRMKPGRTGLCILLSAFQQNQFFEGRASRVASLACSSCTALWSVTSPGWVSEHPLLSASPSREQELECLVRIVKQAVNESIGRSDGNSVGGPEALTTFSLGVLLVCAGQQEPELALIQELGNELVDLANSNESNALGCLFDVMKELVEPLPDPGPPDKRPRDFYAAYDDAANTEQNVSAMSVAYSSIGKELVGATIMAYPHVVETCGLESLALLCDLAAAIFRNNPVLCEQFWMSWNEFTDSRDVTVMPFCFLLDTAHSSASKALASNSPQMLHYIAPHLRFLSSLVFNPESCQAVLEGLAPNCISVAISYCAEGALTAERSLCQTVLNSLHDLARIGRGVTCHDLFREMLCDGPGQMLGKGPQLLSEVAIAFSGKALSVLGLLTRNAPDYWLFPVASCLKKMQESNAHWMKTTDEFPEEVVQLVDSLVMSLSRVAFSEHLDDTQKAETITTVGALVQSIASVLSLSLTSTTKSGVNMLNLCHSVMDCLTGLLEQIRPICDLCSSPVVAETSARVRASVLNLLSPGHPTSSAIAHYATLPVALNLLDAMDKELRDNIVLQTARTKDLTALQSLSDPDQSRSVQTVNMSSLLDELQLSREINNFESCGQTTAGHSTIDAFAVCGSALRLLLHGAGQVEDASKGAGIDSAAYEAWGPARILLERATIPRGARGDQQLLSTWNTSGITVVKLLTRYLEFGRESETPGSVVILTQELLQICLTHSRMATGALVTPEYIGPVMNNVIPDLDKLYQSGKLGQDDEASVDQALRSMKLLETYMECNRSSIPTILSAKGDGSMENWDMLAERIVDTSRLLLSLADGPNCLPADSTFFDKLRVSSGILSIIRCTVLNCPDPELVNCVGERIVQTLLDFVIKGRVIHQAVVEVGDIVGHRISTVLACFTSIALDILSVHCLDAQVDPSPVLLTAIENTADQSLASVVSAVGPLSTVANFGAIEATLIESSRLSDVNETHPIAVLRSFRSPVTKEGSDVNTHDALAAARWYNAKNIGHENKFTSRSLLEVSVAIELFASQAARMTSWTRFSRSFLFLTQSWRKHTQTAQILSTDHALFCSSLFGKAVGTMCKNCSTMSAISTDIRLGTFVADDLQRMLSELSALLSTLALGSVSDTFPRPEIPLDSLCKLNELALCAHKMSSVSSSGELSLDGYLSVAAFLVSKSADSTKPDTQDSLLSLISLSCAVISGARSGKITPCFETAVSLLGASLSRANGFSSFAQTGLISSSRITTTLKEREVIPALVDHIEEACKQCSLAEESSNPASAIKSFRVITTLLSFFTAIASCDDHHIMELLNSNRVASMLTPLFSFIISNERRPQSGSQVIRQVNLHETNLWVAGWMFLGKLISRSSDRGHDGTPSFYFAGVAANILHSHHSTVSNAFRSCYILRSEYTPLCISTIRRCRAVLSVVMALVSEDFIVEFSSKAASLHGQLVDDCKTLARSLANYLGSAAFSRESFSSTSEFESANPGPISPSANNMSKTDAIRYSYFVSRRSKAETTEEVKWQRYILDGLDLPPLPPEPSKQLELERRCREAVTSRFALELEREVAHCLLFSVGILLKSHPARSSIRVLPEGINNQVDIRMIETGNVVAFQLFAGEPTEVGYVQVVDTIERKLKVSLLQSHRREQWEDCWIHASSIVGIEDAKKRRPFLQLRPAPTSPSDLEENHHQLSTGELILAMKWCHHVASNEDITRSSIIGPVAERLAEACTSLLTTETCARRGQATVSTGAGHRQASLLRRQILELYGERAELDEFDSNQRIGCMSGILSEKSWSYARQQFHEEIQLLCVSEDSNKRAALETGPAMAASPTKARYSPFQHLKFNAPN